MPPIVLQHEILHDHADEPQTKRLRGASRSSETDQDIDEAVGTCLEEIKRRLTAKEDDNDIQIVEVIYNEITVDCVPDCPDEKELSYFHKALAGMFKSHFFPKLDDGSFSVIVGTRKYVCHLEQSHSKFHAAYSIYRRIIFDVYQFFPTGVGKAWKGDFLDVINGVPQGAKIPPALQQLLIDRVERSQLSHDFCDHIGIPVYQQLQKMQNSLGRRPLNTVFAGIVLTVDSPDGSLDPKLVCVTTGTKIICGENYALNGTSVHDFHAEILAKRCFRLYLYDQINLLKAGRTSILEWSTMSKKMRLKPEVKVHLYVSTAPCGDCRVNKTEIDMDRKAEHASRGLLRIKLEHKIGEPFIPIPVHCAYRFKYHEDRSPRTRIMTCSDKILMWNVVGIQGALLSHFIEPIYLSSVIVSHVYNFPHLIRGTHFRIFMDPQVPICPEKLPKTFKVNKSDVGVSAKVRDELEHRFGQLDESGHYSFQCPPFSLNWIDLSYLKNSEKLERIDCERGNCGRGPSRLCKYNMLQKFIQIADTTEEGIFNNVTYREAKDQSQDYQKAKKWFKDAMVRNGLGSWLKGPQEVDKFRLNSYMVI